MKDQIYKVSSAVIISLIILLLGVARVVLAQEQDPAKAQQTWRCVAGQNVNSRTQQVHLTASGLPTDTPVYIVGCVETGTNFRCTTGNNEHDAILNLGQNNASQLKNSSAHPLPYEFVVPGGAKRTLPDGTLDITVTSASRHVTNHAFYAVFLSELEVVDRRQGSTLQYGTIEFEQATSACTSVRQDPYGRAFDAQSLEPLPDIAVTLQDETGTAVNQVGVPNPVSTLADGMFNFVVEPGRYMLSPSCQVSTTPHPNFFQAYSNLYAPESVIVETADRPEQRDIACEPAGTPYRAQVQSMSYGVVQLGAEMRVEGQASHPKTTIELIQGETTLATTEADRFGFYKISVANNQIAADEPLALRFLKNDLTAQAQGMLHGLLSSLGLPSVRAQTLTSTVSFDPILRYIEGYAYDKSGTVIPQARVAIKLEMSDQPYFETTADDKGFFAIPPQSLPIFNYYLEYTRPGSSMPIKVTTIAFATANKTYLAENNIDLVSATVDGVALLPTQAPQSAQGQVPGQEKEQPTETAGGFVQSVAGRANLVSVVVALLILIVLIVLLIRLKRQKTDEPPTPPLPPGMSAPSQTSGLSDDAAVQDGPTAAPPTASSPPNPQQPLKPQLS